MGWDADGRWSNDDGWEMYDDGGATVPWYNPETGQVEELANPDYHASPYEAAENEGRLDEFQDYIDTIYGMDPTGQAPTAAGVNLYDPSTYGNYPGGPDDGGDGGGAGSGRSSSGGSPRFPAPSLPSRPGAPRSISPWTEIFQGTAPNPLRPWEQKFNAPTVDEATNSPGFQFRLGEGIKALQRSAAARGTLLTGGTLKGLMQYAGDEASKEYQNVYNRSVGEYESERQNFLGNEANRYGNEVDRYNRQLGEYDIRRQNFLTNEGNRFNSERSNRLDDFNIDSSYFQMGRQNRLDDFNIFNTQDTNYFNRLFGLAGLGNPGQMSGFNANYGNIGSGLMTGMGNSLAAGQVGGANAWANALGGIGQSAILAALLRRPS